MKVPNYKVTVRENDALKSYWVSADRMLTILEQVNERAIFWLNEEKNYSHYCYVGMEREDKYTEIQMLQKIGLLDAKVHFGELTKEWEEFALRLGINNVSSNGGNRPDMDVFCDTFPVSKNAV